MANDYQHKESKGALHRNQFKEQEKHPDYRGGFCWKGEQLEVSAWLNEDKNGKKYLGLEIKEPYSKSDSEIKEPYSKGDSPEPQAQQELATDEEDIPF